MQIKIPSLPTRSAQPQLANSEGPALIGDHGVYVDANDVVVAHAYAHMPSAAPPDGLRFVQMAETPPVGERLGGPTPKDFANAEIEDTVWTLLSKMAYLGKQKNAVVTPAAPLMPADLAALALPDESLADLKVRLLTELTRLRSMAVGRLDMTEAERAMLTTLEGQVAQQWFSS